MGLPWSLLYSQHSAQCLAHGMCLECFRKQLVDLTGSDLAISSSRESLVKPISEFLYSFIDKLFLYTFGILFCNQWQSSWNEFGFSQMKNCLWLGPEAYLQRGKDRVSQFVSLGHRTTTRRHRELLVCAHSDCLPFTEPDQELSMVISKDCLSECLSLWIRKANNSKAVL
jgi:hypothetical protein